MLKPLIIAAGLVGTGLALIVLVKAKKPPSPPPKPPTIPPKPPTPPVPPPPKPPVEEKCYIDVTVTCDEPIDGLVTVHGVRRGYYNSMEFKSKRKFTYVFTVPPDTYMVDCRFYKAGKIVRTATRVVEVSAGKTAHVRFSCAPPPRRKIDVYINFRKGAEQTVEVEAERKVTVVHIDFPQQAPFVITYEVDINGHHFTWSNKHCIEKGWRYCYSEYTVTKSVNIPAGKITIHAKASEKVPYTMHIELFMEPCKLVGKTIYC